MTGGIDDILGDTLAKQEAEDAKRAADEKLARWRRALGDVAGRHLLYELLVDLGAFNPVHGERMAGKHEATLYIIGEIKSAGMDYWLKMIEENEK